MYVKFRVKSFLIIEVSKQIIQTWKINNIEIIKTIKVIMYNI